MTRTGECSWPPWERFARKTGWQIHSFCLMSNHFHVVMETPSANLVEGMKWFLGVYTRRFNRRKKPMTISLTDTFFLFHQKPGMDLPIGFLAGLAQCFQEQLAVFVRAENRLAMVAPIHDMVDGAGILDSDFSGHAHRVRRRAERSLRTAPFKA